MTPTKPRKLTPRQEASSADTGLVRLKELAQDSRLARLVAANPNASPDLLLELSHSDDKAVRKACTSNANTPVEALQKLGSQFPEQMLENPVFDLLLLAHPGLFDEMPTATLNSLLKRDQVPVGLIRWAWKHRGESTVQSLLMNPNTPADVVEGLCKSEDLEVRMAAELHCSRELPRWASEVHHDQDLLAPRNARRFAHRIEIKLTDKWVNITEAALQCINVERGDGLVAIAEAELRIRLASIGLPNSVLKALAQYPEARRTLAGNKYCSQELLQMLASDPQSDVRSAVATNPKVRASTLLLLAKDPDRNVRQTVARNRVTSDDAIKILAKDPDWWVRSDIAEREDLSPSEVELLARDHQYNVRAAVASNSCCSADLLEQLAADKESHVRSSVAINYNSGSDVLEQLSKEYDWDVLRALVDNKKTSGKAWMRAFRRMRSILDGEWERDYREGIDEIHPFAMIVESPSAVADALKELIAEDDYDVRRGVAGSASASQESLAVLSKDKENSVRREVALNQNTSQSVLEVLAQDKEEYVRSGVAGNSKASFDILARLSKDNSKEVRGALARSSHIQYEMMRLLSFDSDWWVRRLLAMNQAVDGRILDSLAADQDSSIRVLIATNTSTQPDTLEKLLDDPEPDVRAALAINPKTPKNVLLVLASDLNVIVKMALATRDNLGQDIIDVLLIQAESAVTKQLLTIGSIADDRISRLWCELFADLLKAACNGGTPSSGRRFLFTLPECPANLLAKNFRSRSWLERFAIAGNRSTPKPVLERMAREGNQLVRRAAAENLARLISAPNQQPSYEQPNNMTFQPSELAV